MAKAASTKLVLWADTLRPRNAAFSVFAFLAGVALAGNTIDTKSFALIILSLFFAHSSATILNDLADTPIDKANNRSSGYQNGEISQNTLQFAWKFFALLSVLAMLLSSPPPEVLAATAMLLLLGTLYSSEPVMASRRPIASVAVLGLTFALLPFLMGATFATDEELSSMIYLASIGWVLVRVSVSILKDYKDFDGDKKYAKRTFLVTYGAKATRVSSIIMALLGYAILAIVLLLYGSTSAYVACLLYSAVGLYGLGLRLKLKVGLVDYVSNNKLFERIVSVTVVSEVIFIVCIWLM